MQKELAQFSEFKHWSVDEASSHREGQQFVKNTIDQKILLKTNAHLQLIEVLFPFDWCVSHL